MNGKARLWLTGWLTGLQVSLLAQTVSYTGGVLTQNFDGMGSSGTTTPPGWFVGYSGSSTLTTVGVSSGTASPDATAGWNFGRAGEADRALGTMATSSGSPPAATRYVEVRIRNDSGTALNTIEVHYDGEQWRTGSSTTDTNRLVLQFSVNGTTYFDLGPAFCFVQPAFTPTSSALDGNAAANRRAGLGGVYTLPAPVAAGGALYLRWFDANENGTDPALAIDSFNFRVPSLEAVAITGQPADLVVLEGAIASLSVLATGYPVLYQWFRAGMPISQATNATLAFAPIRLADADTYAVVVSNQVNRVTSRLAQVSVYTDESERVLPLNHTWRYDQSGADLGTDWTEPGFDDDGWFRGPGVLAQENHPVVTPLTQTVLSLLNGDGQPIIAYYFRTEFTLTEDPFSLYLTFSNLVDDGAVFYLNGAEIFRQNMNPGPVSAATLAMGSADEGVWAVRHLRPDNLQPGANLLTVEVHQIAASSSDVVFGCSLTQHPANWGPVVIVRQPEPAFAAPGADVTLLTYVAGMEPITYQWFKNGIPLAGEIQPKLRLTQLQPATLGTYGVVVSNRFGAVASTLATVSIADWQRSFGGSGTDRLTAMVRTADGGFLLAGFSSSPADGTKTSPNYGQRDFWVVKVAANGAPLWENSYGGSQDDELAGAQLTPDGGFILAGTSSSGADGNKSSPNYGGADYWVVRLDGQGRKLWDRSFGGAANDVARAVLVTCDGGFAVAGGSASPPGGTKISVSFGDTDMWMVRLDDRGQQVWETVVGRSAWEEAKTLASTPEGGFLLAGFGGGGSGGNRGGTYFGATDMVLARLDSGGRLLWDTTYGGADYDGLYAMTETPDGGWILTGDSASGLSGNKTSPNYGSWDAWVVKVNSTGTKLWEMAAGGADNDGLNVMVGLPQGACVVAGDTASGISGNKSAMSFGGGDGWIMGLGPTGLKQWELSFGGTGGDSIDALDQALDGGFLVGLRSSSPPSGNKVAAHYGGDDFWIVKLSPMSPLTEPVIVTQPADVAVPVGSTVTLTAQVAGYPIFYRWFKDGVPVPGATQFRLTIPTTGTAAGTYTLVASNQMGWAVSQPACLTLWGPALQLACETNGMVLTIQGVPNIPLRIEYAPQLPFAGTWPVLTNLLLPASPWRILDPSIDAPGRYYRAVVP